MKKYGIVYTLFLILVVWTGLVSADRRSSSSFSEHYGIVVAIYPKESRLVISDMNLHYTYGTGFYKESGARLSIIKNELKLRSPVRFSFYKTKAGLVLKTLKIVSKREARSSRELAR